MVVLEPNWRPLLVTAIFTGMRSSEIRGLRWQDVDFDRFEITVSQRADEFRQIGAPKSDAGKRTIPVPPVVVNVLKEHKLKQGNKMKLVFGNPQGEPRSHANIINKGLVPAMLKGGDHHRQREE